ncbi:MAG: right-handed parallel beta-helix repeat-containing protein [Mucilaginibacter sp.]|nr:right-handed parallel beta-helix repeat-containing protein [Mucilaginibacter sp.]
MEEFSYRATQPIVLNGAHDITICDCSISGGTATCINLVNCYNIHITQCQLLDSEKPAVSLTECADIIIDNCYVANVSDGIRSLNGINIQVRNNRMRQLGPKGIMVAFENAGAYAGYASSSVNNILE